MTIYNKMTLNRELAQVYSQVNVHCTHTHTHTHTLEEHKATNYPLYNINSSIQYT